MPKITNFTDLFGNLLPQGNYLCVMWNIHSTFINLLKAWGLFFKKFSVSCIILLFRDPHTILSIHTTRSTLLAALSWFSAGWKYKVFMELPQESQITFNTVHLCMPSSTCENICLYRLWLLGGTQRFRQGSHDTKTSNLSTNTSHSVTFEIFPALQSKPKFLLVFSKLKIVKRTL